ncbi:MAG: LptA/OstA family protein [Inquilinus sp.]|uniref:LptA/OstA family protein n=1 Tax=Inquilinus sp. TaxID=1932117 RepID=UPI003F301D62
MIRPLILAVLLSAAAMPALAQQQLQLGGGKNEPSQIQADDALEWHQNEKTYVARGNAVYQRGELTVKADVLTAYYRELPDKSTEIFRATAEGNVLITRGDTTSATGGKGVYELDAQTFTLTGGNLKFINNDDVITATDSMVYRQAEDVAIARGNATATRAKEQKSVRADTLTGHFAPNEKGEKELSVVDADGNVKLTTPTDVVTGRTGRYDVKAQFATITDDVRMTRGGNQLNGDYAEVDMASGVSKLLTKPGQGGRARALLVPDEKGQSPGGLPGQPAVPAPSAPKK